MLPALGHPAGRDSSGLFRPLILVLTYLALSQSHSHRTRLGKSLDPRTRNLGSSSSLATQPVEKPGQIHSLLSGPQFLGRPKWPLRANGAAAGLMWSTPSLASTRTLEDSSLFSTLPLPRGALVARSSCLSVATHPRSPIPCRGMEYQRSAEGSEGVAIRGTQNTSGGGVSMGEQGRAFRREVWAWVQT